MYVALFILWLGGWIYVIKKIGIKDILEIDSFKIT